MSRLTKRSIALYDHLTAKEKAAVALGIMDAEELDVIASTVERKTYRQLDASFLDWGDYAFKISTVLGLEYWQAKANEYSFKHAIRGAALVADVERESEEMAKHERELMASVIAAIPQAQANQAAALEALQTLSTEHGFAYEDCLRLAGIKPEETERLEDVEPSAGRLDYFIDNLRSVAPKL